MEEAALFFKWNPAQDLPVLCNCYISSEEKIQEIGIKMDSHLFPPA